ncbi:hypothetical protein KGO95_01520 [Patescibacteria group bacterium]|nr:hypothetical protein [Patescibacteria group bacterium]
MRYKNIQKIIAGILIGTLFFPQLSALQAPAPKAHAVLGVGDITFTDVIMDPTTLLYYSDMVTATDLNSSANTASWATKILELAKQVAYAAFKAAILDQLVQALINWINNDGKGPIIADWNQFFYNAENNAAGAFIDGLSGGVLCSPFNLQVQLSLAPVQNFSDVTCTLNQVIGNIDSFISDFRNGSWLAYQQIWDPQNNFYGAAMIAQDDLLKQEYSAVNTSQTEGIAGQGFLSFTKCDYTPDPNGSYVQVGGNYILASTNNASSRYSKSCHVTTPAQVAVEATKQALVDVGIGNIINSQDLSAYLTAIFNAAINRLKVAAANGLVGLLSDATQGVHVNPVFPCAGITGQAFTACMQSVNSEKNLATSYQDQSNTLVTSVLDVRQQINDTLTQAIALESPYVDALTQLSACQASATATLATEQGILNSLQDSLSTNQTYLDTLNGLSTPIVTATSSSVTADDLAKISAIASAATAAANNIGDANAALQDAKNQLQTIQANVSANLPGIQAQLLSCPVISATSTTP